MEYLKKHGKATKCGYFLETYKCAYERAVEAQKKLDAANRPPGTLAPLGGMSIHSKYFFVQLGHNFWGRHDYGHSDITLWTLKDLQTEFKLTADGEDLMIRSSQVPDLYRWMDDAFHAHTPEYIEENRAWMEFKGQREFMSLMDYLIEEIHYNMKDWTNPDALKRAIFFMGVAVHPIQDLVYHKGMTLAQHSGLSYYLKQNPDTPYGYDFKDMPTSNEARKTEAGKQFDLAKDYTKRFIKTIIQAINKKDKKGVEKIRKWKKGDQYNFIQLANDGMNGEQDMSYDQLLKYWLLKFQYQNGEKNDEELKIKTKGGLMVWDIESMMVQIEDKIKNIVESDK